MAAELTPISPAAQEALKREAEQMSSIVLLSGGLDSTVLLWYLLKQGYHVRCLSVNYMQKHRKELEAAAYIARSARCEHFTSGFQGLAYLFAGSSQTSPEIPVPEGHYAEESMKVTVVPNRNMVFLSLAIAWAVSTKSQSVAYAAHAGDHTIYPDCRPAFVDAMSQAALLCDWHPVSILRPFISKSKAELVTLGAKIGAPLHLTWSCYKGGSEHCGKCGTCVERKEAFALAGVADPTKYEGG